MSDVFKRLETCACFRMRAASRVLTRDYDEALKPAGLKVTQFTVLAMIAGTKPRSITQMAELLSMERTSLVRTLNLLEKRELVKLGVEGNRRERRVYLTTLGVEAFEHAVPYWERAQSKAESKFGSGVWKTLWKQIADFSLR